MIFTKKSDGLYGNDDIQAMIETLGNKTYKKEFSAVLKTYGCSSQDKSAILDCLSEGYCERFDRYDSAVCETFVRVYELWVDAKGVKA